MDTGACTKGVAVITGVTGSWVSGFLVGTGDSGGHGDLGIMGNRDPGSHGDLGGHEIWVTGNKKPGGILGFWGAGFLEAAKCPAAVGWGRFWGQGSKFQEYFLTR